jgi:hypothetical protein
MGKFWACSVVSRKRAEAIAGLLGFTLPATGQSHVVIEVFDGKCCGVTVTKKAWEEAMAATASGPIVPSREE